MHWFFSLRFSPFFACMCVPFLALCLAPNASFYLALCVTAVIWTVCTEYSNRKIKLCCSNITWDEARQSLATVQKRKKTRQIVTCEMSCIKRCCVSTQCVLRTHSHLMWIIIVKSFDLLHGKRSIHRVTYFIFITHNHYGYIDKESIEFFFVAASIIYLRTPAIEYAISWRERKINWISFCFPIFSCSFSTCANAVEFLMSLILTFPLGNKYELN